MAKVTMGPLVPKADFPLLARQVHGRRLVYLDSASSSQRPQAVLDAMDDYYCTTHANVHRGVYAIAEEADRRYEAARVAVGNFIGAPDPEHEVIFTKNASEAINLVASSWGRQNLQAGDAVLLTDMEHHSNIVPWLALAERARDRAALDRCRRAVPSRSLRSRPSAGRRQARGVHRHVERARIDPSVRPDSRAGSRARARSCSPMPPSRSHTCPRT